MVTDDEIHRAVGERAFDAGERYQLEGRVLALHVSADGSTISSSVRGSGRRVYDQSIRLNHRARGRTTEGGTQVSGSCSCPVGFNCKHVAAVLLEYQEQEEEHPVTAIASPAPWQPGVPVRRSAPDQASSLSSPAGQSADKDALPHGVENWLRGLDAAGQADSEDYPSTVRKRLLYVLAQGSLAGGMTVRPQSIELRRDDTPSGTITRHEPGQLLRAGQQPKFLRPSDRAILRQFTGAGAEAGEAFVSTLRAMIATGRGRWATWDGPVLTEGAPVQGEVEWRLNDDGSQQPRLVLPEGLVALRLALPWYVEAATGRMGPVETALPPRLLRAMLTSPAVPPALVDRVRAELTRRGGGHRLPIPRTVAPPQLLREPMRPHLLLLAGDLPFDPAAVLSSGRYRQPSLTELHPVALARASWRYGPVSIPADAPFQPDQVVQRDGVLFQLRHDRKAEEQAVATLDELGLERLSRFHLLPDTHPHAHDLALLDPDLAGWLELVLHDVPRLRDEGWTVEVADSFPVRLVQPTGDVDIQVTESSGIDWFDVDLGVMLDGQRISLVPAVLDWIATVGLDAAAGEDDQLDDEADDDEDRPWCSPCRTAGC